VHTIDLLLWLLGDVIRVHARTATLRHSIEAEDTAVAKLEFASGALGVFHATTAAYPGYPRRIEITGTRGTVILEHDRIVATDLIAHDLKYDVSSAADENRSASSAVVSDFRGHQAIFEDFINAVANNSAPICDGVEGRRSIALIEAIYRASRDSDRALAV